jgi:hypothetical protein
MARTELDYQQARAEPGSATANTTFRFNPSDAMLRRIRSDSKRTMILVANARTLTDAIRENRRMRPFGTDQVGSFPIDLR